jgi:hypothetical protein
MILASWESTKNLFTVVNPRDYKRITRQSGIAASEDSPPAQPPKPPAAQAINRDHIDEQDELAASNA